MTTLLYKIWRGIVDKRERNPCFSVTVALLFCLALSLVHCSHELWRDEIHCWSLARNATGLWDLLTGDRRYDGHPFLWYYLLHLVSLWSRSEVYLHAVTIVLATASAFLWLRDANLPRILRVMFLCTYCFFYEYSVISRSYVLGIFLAFLFCRLYDPRSLRLLRLFVVLFFLSFTSAYGALLTGALGAFLLWQSVARVLSGQLESRQKRTIYWQWCWGLCIFAAALFIHIKTSLPPPDAYYTGSWVKHTKLLSPDGFPKQFWSALFPWRTHNDGKWIVSDYLGYKLPAIENHLLVIATATLLLWLIALRKSKAVAFTLLLGVAAISLFQAHQYRGYLRHWGHFLILIAICIWLYAKLTEQRRVLLYLLAIATMTVQIFTNVRAVRAEIDMPFSGAKEAADYLRTNGLAQEPILATFDHSASAVAGYLDRRFLFAETGEERQTVVFHDRRYEAPTDNDILVWARATIEELGKPIILLLDFELGPERLPDIKVEPLYLTKPCLRADETFRIYRVSLQSDFQALPP